jgi:hypothetical protein
MRIISSFHDFYDTAQAHGQDRSIVYLRKEERVNYPFSIRSVFSKRQGPPVEGYPLLRHLKRGYGVCFTGTIHTIGFCGKVYPCIELDRFLLGHAPYDYNASDNNRFCFSIEDVDRFVREHFPRQFESYAVAGEKPHSWWRNRKWKSENRRANFLALFEDAAKRQDDFRSFFDDRKVPVFVGTHQSFHLDVDGKTVFHDGKIVYNAPLKPFGFQRVFDPFRAFQEINMFLNNIAWPNRDIPTMSNQENAERLGHGDRYSFRTAPTKHV